MSKPHEYELPVRYTYQNPPPSFAVAANKLEKVQGDIVVVVADLQTKTEADYRTPADYANWKLKAERALGFLSTEESFLQRWIERKQDEEKITNKTRDIEQVRDELSAMVSQFLSTTLLYTPLYSKDNLPKTLKDVKQRRAALVKIKTELEKFLSSLRKQSIRICGTSAPFDSAKKGVVETRHEIETELLVVNRTMHILIVPIGTYFRGNHISMIKYLLGITEHLIRDGKLAFDENARPKYEEILPLKDI